MSAVFEIQLLYKKNIELSKIENILSKYNHNLVKTSFKVMDDWKYSNYRELQEDEFEEIENFINQNKIVTINGVIDDHYRFGINWEKIKCDLYSVDFWISTEDIKVLDNNYITKENIEQYTLVSQVLTEELKIGSLLLCGLGSEIVINVNDGVANAVNYSKNICEWIFPYTQSFDLLKTYEKTVANGFTVYCLYE